MNKARSVVAALATMLLTIGGATAAELRIDQDRGTEITVQRPGLYPEGIDYDATTDRFFLSSVRDGVVTTVDPDGRHSTFARDDRLISTIGIRVDADRRRLLVANGDYGVAANTSEQTNRKAGGLAIFQLDSGVLLHYVDLAALQPGAPIFPNDLDIDADGNAYVTNSLSPLIYRVAPSGEAAVFIEDERFAGPGFSLNGIRVHPDGFLLVAKKSDGSLFRVPLDAPQRWSEVRLPERFIATDGILLAGDTLLLLRNRTAGAVANELVVLHSRDGWETAAVTERAPTADDYATTATIRAGEIWASEGRLHTLKPGADASASSFSVRRVATVARCS